MPTAEVNHTTLFYDESGSGPPMLLMHGGLGIDHTYFRESLAPLANNHRLILYDHRCNGRSGRPSVETLTIEQLADDAAALLTHLGIRAADIFGHSYGGFVAQEFALRHPGLVRRLVLCDTTPGQLGRGESAEPDEQGPPPPPEVAKAFEHPPGSNADFELMMQELMPAYFYQFDADAHLAFLRDTVFTLEAMQRGFEVLAEWSSVDRLCLIDRPTLVLAGRHDVFTSPPQSTRIAKRIPGAVAHIFEESGHFPWMEEPAEFFRVVRGWLADAGEGST